MGEWRTSLKQPAAQIRMAKKKSGATAGFIADEDVLVKGKRLSAVERKAIAKRGRRKRANARKNSGC